MNFDGMPQLFRREPISLLSVVNLVLALVGVALVVRPTFLFGGDPTHSDPEYPYAAAGAAVGAVCQGAMHVVLRLLREAHFACVLACFGAVSTAVTAAGGLAPLPFGGSLCVPECGAGRLAVVAIGVLTFFGQIGLTTAPKLESAAVVSLFVKMSDVLLALLIQTLWFKVWKKAYIQPHLCKMECIFSQDDTRSLQRTGGCRHPHGDRVFGREEGSGRPSKRSLAQAKIPLLVLPGRKSQQR